MNGAIAAACAAACAAGRSARAHGLPATANPHHDWELGAAWASGWHGVTRMDVRRNPQGAIEIQAKLVGCVLSPPPRRVNGEGDDR